MAQPTNKPLSTHFLFDPLVAAKTPIDVATTAAKKISGFVKNKKTNQPPPRTTQSTPLSSSR